MRIYLYFAFFCLFLALSSCVTQRACQKHFPPSRDTVRIVTVRDSIVIRDTTVFIKIPGETVHDSVVIPCPDPGPAFIPDTAIVRTDFAIAKAWFQFPTIKLRLTQPDTTLQIRLDNAIKEAWHWKTEYEKITVTPQPIITKYIPGIYKVAFWLWVGVLNTIAGYVAFRIFILKK
jgi:hypothetical protein